MLVEKSEGAEKLINGSSLIVSVGDGELRARGQAGAERDEKQGHGQDERFDGRAWENGNVKLCARVQGAPITRDWDSV